MQSNYRYSFTILLASTILFFSMLFQSCEKESDSRPPTLTLLGTAGSITGDTQAKEGDTLTFHLRAKQGTDKLLSLKVNVNGNLVKDSTFSSPGYELKLNLIKSTDSVDVIRFIVSDYKSRTAQVTVSVTLAGAKFSGLSGVGYKKEEPGISLHPSAIHRKW